MKQYIIPIVGVILLGGCSKIEVPNIKKNSITKVETEYSKSLRSYSDFTNKVFSELKKDISGAKYGVFSQQTLNNKNCRDIPKFGKYKNTTNDDGLVDAICFNYENNNSQVLTSKRFFLVNQIQNKTKNKELPDDIRYFITSALNNLNKDYAVVSTISGGDFNDNQGTEKGSYRIIGGITGYDNLYTKSKSKYIDIYGGKGKGETDASFDNTNDKEVTEITLDLALESFDSVKRLWTYVPFRSVSNTIYIVKDKKSGGVNISVTGLSFNFSETVNFGEGLHYALRLLSEKSLLDLLGKMDDIPYWSFYPTKYLKQYTNECIAKIKKINQLKQETNYVNLVSKKNKTQKDINIINNIQKLSKDTYECKEKIIHNNALADKNWERTLSDKIWKNRQEDSLKAREKALLNILYNSRGSFNRQLKDFLDKHKELKKDYRYNESKFLVRLFEYTILKLNKDEVISNNKYRVKRLFR